MITLFLKNIIGRFRKYSPFRKIIKHCNANSFPLHIQGPEGPSLAFVVSQIQELTGETSLIVVPTEQDAENLVRDLSLFSSRVKQFPWLHIVPYTGTRTHISIAGQRMAALAALLQGEASIIVLSVRSLLFPLPDPDFIRDRCLPITPGAELMPEEINRYMTEIGYFRVPKVTVPGEYALRGEVLDFFPPGYEEAVRIIFEFETVEEIRTFNPDTQFSTGKIEKTVVYPVRETVWTEERISMLETKGTAFEEAAAALREGKDLPDEEIIFRLSFREQATVLDYLPRRSTVYFSNDKQLEITEETILKEAEELYSSSRYAKVEELAPESLFFSLRACSEKVRRKVIFPTIWDMQRDETKVTIPVDGPRSFFGNIRYLREELDKLVEAGYSIWVFSESETQAPKLEHMLKEYPLEVVVGSISAGFTLPDLKIVIIQENEIFGRRKRVPKSVKRAKSEVIDTFVELNPGDYVVHVNYGIGKFHGIERITAAGTERDYIQLEYAGEEMIFIPIEQVNLVQKYIGADGAAPRLDRIGGRAWETRKNKVKKSVEDLAERLIKLYSRRQQAKGFGFPDDTEWQVEFEAAFPYEETPDQLTCIRQVKEDMEAQKPMDRMICGDVGFGKTEVAMRAAFKAVTAGKQVAVLAPTTILAEQHYDNFAERFEHFPVEIRMLSRFIGKGVQKRTIEDTGEGRNDILIGTHRILQRDVQFKNLGLIVIDEEQRFGVKDKERLKELKASVDCLTLTATPIPRTLHMSLLKIRDMSLLRTPPSNRLPIETFIGEFREETVKEAIEHELSRGGQVFYLHNRIQTLEQVRRFLSHLIPRVRVDIAHGRMESHELEDVMHRFIHGGSQVLLSTSIIENGIDIPNVNTMIIDRADMYGLSQLYQLRGRVGRADKPAYAYLLYPEERVITEAAMKRLKILSEYTDLGSGFKIAMKDLEVRGAGNLLGREQHGDILAVGFDMYIRLLDEAIAELREEKTEEEEVYLELDYSGYVPDSYISDPSEKMEVYKRIVSVQEETELQAVFAELEDRFGPMPEAVQSLLSLAEIRVLCRRLHISALRERKKVLEIEFGRVSEINADKVVTMIQESGGSVRLDPKEPNILHIETGVIGLKEKSEFIREKLSTLM